MIRHNMLPHLRKQRNSKIYKEFNYKKTLVPAVSKRNEKSLVVAWDVYYLDSYITTLSTLKEVHHFIDEKANS